MKIKRIITGTVALLMLCCSSVLAESSQRKEVVNFNIGAENGGELTAVITKSNESTIRWMGIVNADESGNVNFSVELEDYYDNELSDGAYTLTLIGKNKYEKYQENFSYKSTPTREQVLQGITDEASVIALFTDSNVREELNAMGLYIDEFSDLGDDEQSKVASKVVALTEKTEKTMSEEIGPYVIYLKCINDGTEKFAENLDKYALECFGVDTESELYKKLIAEKDEKALYEYIKNLGDTALSKLKANPEDVIITSLFRSTIDGGEMQRIISTYGEYAGFDMTKYNNAADKQAFAIYMIADYDKSDDVKSRYNSYTPPSTPNRPNGGGSSGGGSGSRPVSSGTGGGISINTSEIEKPIVEYKPIQSLEEKYNFSDMTGYDWAKEAVVQLAARGIVSGIGDNLFAPGREITREEFAKLVSLAFEIKDGGDSVFTDVAYDRWSFEAISALANAGIIGGIGDNMFAPEMFITRQDMAVIIDRALTKKGIIAESENKEDFNDINDVADYAKDSVTGLYKSGILSGTGDGNYNPFNYVTRAEAAQILYNCLNAIGGEN